MKLILEKSDCFFFINNGGVDLEKMNCVHNDLNINVEHEVPEFLVSTLRSHGLHISDKRYCGLRTYRSDADELDDRRSLGRLWTTSTVQSCIFLEDGEI